MRPRAGSVSPRCRSRAASTAESITCDPPVPYGTGVLLVRDPTRLAAAHSDDDPGDYLQDITDGALPDYAHLGTELTREHRGLRLWLPLHLHGVGAFREALNEKLDLAGHAYLSSQPNQRSTSRTRPSSPRWSSDSAAAVTTPTARCSARSTTAAGCSSPAPASITSSPSRCASCPTAPTANTLTKHFAPSGPHSLTAEITWPARHGQRSPGRCRLAVATGNRSIPVSLVVHGVEQVQGDVPDDLVHRRAVGHQEAVIGHPQQGPRGVPAPAEDHLHHPPRTIAALVDGHSCRIGTGGRSAKRRPGSGLDDSRRCHDSISSRSGAFEDHGNYPVSRSSARATKVPGSAIVSRSISRVNARSTTTCSGVK